MVAVFTLPAAGAAWPLLPPEEVPPEEVPDELHPTTSAAAAAPAGSANSIHGRRLRAFSVVRDLSIAFSFACWGSPRPGRGTNPPEQRLAVIDQSTRQSCDGKGDAACDGIGVCYERSSESPIKAATPGQEPENCLTRPGAAALDG